MERRRKTMERWRKLHVSAAQVAHQAGTPVSVSIFVCLHLAFLHLHCISAFNLKNDQGSRGKAHTGAVCLVELTKDGADEATHSWS